MKTIYLKGTSASSESDATSALMVTVKRPVGVTQGDLLMAHVRSSPGVRIQSPRGWDFVSSDTLQGDQVRCYTRIAASAEPERFSWSFTPKDCTAVVEVHAYSGVHTPWYSRVQAFLGLNGRSAANEGEVVDEGQSVILDEAKVNTTSYSRPLVPELKIKTVSSGNGLEKGTRGNGSAAEAE